MTLSRHRWLWVTLILVALLCGGVALVDRVAVGFAERKLDGIVVDAAASHGVSAQSTVVQVRGFPFISQLFFGEFSHVTVNMTGVRTAQLRIAELQADAYDIAVPRGVILGQDPAQAHAERVIGKVGVTTDDLVDALNLSGLALRTDKGQLRISGTVRAAGSDVYVEVAVSPRVAGTQVWLEVGDIDVKSELPSSLVAEAESVVRGLLATRVSLSELPFDLRLNDVRVENGRIVLLTSATNVDLAGV